jgi:hypothetical protein
MSNTIALYVHFHLLYYRKKHISTSLAILSPTLLSGVCPDDTAPWLLYVFGKYQNT